MQVAESIGRHRFLSLVVGTVIVQAVALSLAFYVRSGVTGTGSVSPSPDAVPAEQPAAVPAPSTEPVSPEDISAPHRQVTHTVKRGDTLSSIWVEHGAARSGGLQAARAFETAEVRSALREGDELELGIALSGDIVLLRKHLPDGRSIELTGDSTSGYTAAVTTPKIEEQERTVTGFISESFALAARQQDVPWGVIDELVDLLSNRVAFERALQPGDVFTIRYTERRTTAGRPLEPGPILAASLETGGRMIAAIRHAADDGVVRYFNEQGRVLGNFFLRYPLKFSRISSTFSGGRFHPVLQRTRAHNGVDFAAPIGTPVRTIGDGVVTFAGFRRGAGNMVRIRHCDRYETEYMHLASIGKGVRAGGRVDRGSLIGTVGMTGLATGPHLHFGLFDRGRYINPLKAELSSGADTTTLPPHILEPHLQLMAANHAQVRTALALAAPPPKA